MGVGSLVYYYSNHTAFMLTLLIYPAILLLELPFHIQGLHNFICFFPSTVYSPHQAKATGIERRGTNKEQYYYTRKVNTVVHRA